MADIIAWRFLVFAAVCGLLLYCQFYLAHRQWRKLKGERAGEIDVNYVRREDYLAQSFRTKVMEWLKLPASEDDEAGSVILKGREKIRVLGAGVDLALKEDCHDILVVRGNFSCGPGCTLSRELLIHGNAAIGPGSRLQSLAADGDLNLGEHVSVARWVDSGGELAMGDGCHAGSRVTSRTRIRLALGVQVSSVSAPEIVTAGWVAGAPADNAPVLDLPLIDLTEESAAGSKEAAKAGLKPDRIVQLGADTWFYKGDLVFSDPVRLANKLVVKGNCSFPGGSVLESDVKAAGSLTLGPSCTIRGNLVTDGDLFIGAGCQFSGLLYAGKGLLLSRGSRGLRPDGQIAVYAGDGLSVETDVSVHGKLTSHNWVRIVDAVAAEEWKTHRKIKVHKTALESTTS
jgi:predicted acyltransferase (DUF342 family)